jgi:hypothetical protein
MSDPRNWTEVRETHARAAEIRRQWSPSERKRRQGLPPDAPWSLLRQLFSPHRQEEQLNFDRPGRQWCPAPVTTHR